MPTTKPPSLRLHPRGLWHTVWGGKSYYFGRDQSAARVRYAENLTAWATWRSTNQSARAAITARKPLSVAEAHARWLTYLASHSYTAAER